MSHVGVGLTETICSPGALRVPCGGPSASVRSLGSEALQRYQRAKNLEEGDMEDGDMEFSLRRFQSALVDLGQGLFKIKLTPEAEEKAIKCRELIDAFIREGKLQANVIRSHSAGVGAPLSAERTRMLLALRINVLAKGHSGVSMETLNAMIKAFNGHGGSEWRPRPPGPPHPGPDGGGQDVLEGHGLKPVVLKPKEAMERSLAAARQADIIAALSLEALKGTTRAFHSGSWSGERHYHFCPEVHELASMSERRTERLVNPALSDLPAFLVQDGGLNSGFMIAHCTAAALVSENKALCHPSSVDSLSTSAATEDHVSMGGWAARKALRVVEHVEQVLAIELLAACQALEFLRPLKTTAPLEGVYQLLRSVVSPWDRDRVMSPDIEAAHTLIRQQKATLEDSPAVHGGVQEEADHMMRTERKAL
ncbi:hypothetical protein F7725_022017 [Dissostichus mawsoni]|uniref:Histidine ammonia-lyase n=1 Tax=Dissostichus mawsoni TaxID=36200 RepID=A0A7J5ZGW0_DISMA|nr:hypothetical protein F7725_022017 [Dissostichus mawsoni]